MLGEGPPWPLDNDRGGRLGRCPVQGDGAWDWLLGVGWRGSALQGGGASNEHFLMEWEVPALALQPSLLALGLHSPQPLAGPSRTAHLWSLCLCAPGHLLRSVLPVAGWTSGSLVV